MGTLLVLLLGTLLVLLLVISFWLPAAQSGLEMAWSTIILNTQEAIGNSDIKSSLAIGEIQQVPYNPTSRAAHCIRLLEKHYPLKITTSLEQDLIGFVLQLELFCFLGISSLSPTALHFQIAIALLTQQYLFHQQWFHSHIFLGWVLVELCRLLTHTSPPELWEYVLRELLDLSLQKGCP